MLSSACPEGFGVKCIPHGLIMDQEGIVEYNYGEFGKRLDAMIKAQEMFRGATTVVKLSTQEGVSAHSGVVQSLRSEKFAAEVSSETQVTTVNFG